MTRLNTPTISQTCLALLCTWICFSAQAESTTAIADDGREVILKENGEWEYVTEDLFATTPNGQRIRLKTNQRWQKVRDADAPAYQPVAITTRQRDTASIDESNITVVLDQVQIENQRTDAGKNTRLRSNLVFYLELTGDVPELAPTDFIVQDNRGRDYPVFLVEAGTAPIGGQPRWLVRAKGAPRWWGVKFFSLRINPGSLGNPEQLDLRKPMSDVISKDVATLPE